MQQQAHIINRQVLDLRIDSREKAFALQGRVAELYNSRMLAILDNVLNELVPPGEVIIIDKIEIDLETFAEHELEEKLTRVFEDKVREELAAHVQWPLKKITASHSRLELLKHYLKTGMLPWWANKQQPEMGRLLEDLIAADRVKLTNMLAEIAATESPVKRLLNQFAPGALYKLEQSLLQIFTAPDRKIVADLFAALLSAMPAAQQQEIRLRSLLAAAAAISDASPRPAGDNILAQQLSRSADSTGASVPQNEQRKLKYASHNSSLAAILSFAMQSPAVKTVVKHSLLLSANDDRQRAVQLAKELVASPSLPKGAPTLFSEEKENQTASIIPANEVQDDESMTPKKIGRHKKAATKKETKSQEEPGIARSADGSAADIGDLIIELSRVENVDDARAAKNDEEADTGTAYIENAGIVLLAPFLPVFFRTLGLTEGRKFKSRKHALKAVHLLQYLVTGKPVKHEYSLVFNKLLCGMQVNENIGEAVKLTKKEKAEAGQLIADAIAHWKTLKNTSVKYFREAFLQRDGILSKKENSWLLRVERKSYDLLLESIPWGISMVKLPWSKNLFHVEW